MAKNMAPGGDMGSADTGGMSAPPPAFSKPSAKPAGKKKGRVPKQFGVKSSAAKPVAARKRG